jgi:hypothetical protein
MRPSAAVFRRRRLVLALAVAITVVTGLSLTGLLSSGPAGRSARPTAVSSASLQSTPVGVKFYVVQPGDTLWGIAILLAGNGDPRPIMQRLARQVPGGVLVVGQRLTLS